MRKLNKQTIFGLIFTIIFSTAIFAQNPAERYRPNRNYQEVRQINFQLPFFNQPQLIDVEIIDGKIIFEGDIVLGNAEMLTVPQTYSTGNRDRRWGEGVIPYVLSGSHPEYGDIKTAIENLNNSTNLTLVPRNSHNDYIEFDNTFGCASKVGKQGGKQIINVQNCGVDGIMHEIMHAAGFYHEQSRSDRDNYVTINWENIEAGKEHNFKTYSARSLSGTDIGGYDYNSIMHYGATDFSKNGKPTISPKNPSVTIGSGGNLSIGDMEGIRSMYPTKFSGIGMAYKLAGPRVAANPQDRRVLTMGDRILVVTADGRVFAHNLGSEIGQGYQLQSNQRVAANPQDKWVLAMGNRIVVIVNDGRVFAHDVNGNTVGNAYQMAAPPVAANAQDKWVMAAGNRILVVTASGGVFAHDVSNVVGPGYQLRSNQRVAANAQDRWTLALNKPNGDGYRLAVITNDGRVFVHDINGNEVRNAYQLGGQKVAANAVDRWVLPIRRQQNRDVFFQESIMVITQDGGAFVHDLSE